MSDEISPETVRARVVDELDLVISSLCALDEVANSPLPAEIRDRVTDAVLDQTATIDAEVATGFGPRSDPSLDHAAAYLGLFRDENSARRFLGMAPNPGISAAGRRPTTQGGPLVDPMSMVETIASRLESLIEVRIGDLVSSLPEPQQLAEKVASALGPVVGNQPPKKTMLFSEAVEAKIKKEGKGYRSAATLRRKARVFLALSEDRPVAEITGEQLESFADEFVWLPPSGSRGRKLDVDEIRALVAQNKAAEGETASATTVTDYLNWARIVIKFGCVADHVPYVLDNVRIKIPSVAKPAEERTAPDIESLDAVFRYGISTNILSDALLGPLGLLTGRRIGLLAFLQRQDIFRRNGVWIVRPSHKVTTEDGRVLEVPFKTKDSKREYVLHDFFSECGFIEWAKRADGPVFSFLLKAKDPADTAQKRMTRVYRGSGANPIRSGTFHGLRHGNIQTARDLELDDITIRDQVGHARPKDPHANYAPGFSPAQSRRLATSPLPEGVAWSMFMNLDWEAMATRRPTGGRPPKKR